MENVRLHAQDSFFALLVTYLKLTSRNILADFDVDWVDADRQVTIDTVPFRIVKIIVGQAHQIPGVNITFYDELPTFPRANNRGLSRAVTIHLYNKVSYNTAADDRTLLKLQRKVDEALYGKGLELIDFYADPAVRVAGKAVHWEILNLNEGWLELTDLASKQYLHRAKSLRLFYEDSSIT